MYPRMKPLVGRSCLHILKFIQNRSMIEPHLQVYNTNVLLIWRHLSKQLPEEGVLFTIHPRLQLQCRILPKWRYDEAEEQCDQHEYSRKDNLKHNPTISWTTPSERSINQSSNDRWTSGCSYLSKEAPPAPARIKPAFDKESPQLLPRQPPAHCGNSNVTISTQRICFLRFCKSKIPVRLMGIHWGQSQQASCSDYHQSRKRSLPGEDLESPINLMHGFWLCGKLF